MTRKDYILIAEALAQVRPGQCPSVARNAESQHIIDCFALANALGRNNPRFDRRRFFKACGITAEDNEAT